LVMYVKDYYKWLVCREIRKRVPKWDGKLRKKRKTRTLW
jgi:hypothetical protein